MRSLIGRAELLAYLSTETDDRLTSIADCFGFTSPLRQPESFKAVKPSQQFSDQRWVDVAIEVEQQSRPAEPFYYLAAIEPSQIVPEVAQGEKMPLPAWLQDPRLTLPLSPIPGRDDAPPGQQPLTRWEKIWPVLRHLLSVTGIRNRPDIERLVKRVAEGQFPERIPCLPHRGWAVNAVILYDLPDRLRPFAEDYDHLLTVIGKMRGETGLHIQQVVDHPGGRVRTGTGRNEKNDDWRMPSPGDPLLILGDAGLLDLFGDAHSQWLTFGERLRKAGCSASLLSPLPARYLTAEITGLFHCLHWDRQSDLQLIHSPQSLDDVQAAQRADMRTITERLLPWLSPSALVEPELLRAICRLLALDAGFEALTRVHEDVHASSLGLHIRHDLHTLANRNPAQAEQMYYLFKKHHAKRYATEFYEEIQVFAGTGAIRKDSLMEDAEIYFQRLFKELKELIDGSNVGRTTALQHFGTNFVLRQAARTKAEKAYISSFWAILNKGLGLEDAKPDWLQVEAALPLLCDAAAMKEWHVHQQGEQLLVSGNAGLEEARTISPLFSFTSSTALIAEEFADEEGRRQTFYHTLGQEMCLTFHLHRGPWRLHANGKAFVLSALTLPSWAEGIGRDREGLFVDFRRAQHQCRSYWLPPTVHRSGGWQTFPPGEIGSDKFGVYVDVAVKGVVQRFRLIEPGNFVMGSPRAEKERSDSETLHKVTLSRGFWLADTTVTQELWQAVTGNNPSRFKDNPANPVEKVSWRDAQEFISRLNELIPGLLAQLPTEAQWEYACRAGTTTAFSFGDNITPEQVNYDGNYPYAGGKKGKYRKKTVPVKSLPPNPWGLYEMHGNVWEWCEDVCKSTLGVKPVTDPLHEGADDGDTYRVVRGGSWSYNGRSVRSAIRSRNEHDDRLGFIGFRLSLGHAEPGQEKGGGAA